MKSFTEIAKKVVLDLYLADLNRVLESYSHTENTDLRAGKSLFEAECNLFSLWTTALAGKRNCADRHILEHGQKYDEILIKARNPEASYEKERGIISAIICAKIKSADELRTRGGYLHAKERNSRILVSESSLWRLNKRGSDFAEFVAFEKTDVPVFLFQDMSGYPTPPRYLFGRSPYGVSGLVATLPEYVFGMTHYNSLPINPDEVFVRRKCDPRLLDATNYLSSAYMLALRQLVVDLIR